ncbi:hypothetical protein [Dyadobacter sp. MSC1_007]|jgi:hypothetical protein|uniref:hypothetical protein n=1 Tax=Dyadobacter sp. MSC1_007 TaxID=2909264 RepID=UPI00202FF6B0|nr:hypothetical protein [Dyadobacter sp. MSC1_007]
MRRLLPGVIICLIILLYFLYNFHFSVNFPFQDDFLLIQFIEVVSQGGLGFFGLIKEMFRTFNDHKAVIPRFISLVEYGITGHLNFRFYIVLVLINIIYIFYFVYLQFKKSKLPLYYFIPVPFLFFQPLFHEISGWALNGMQHSYLTAFTVTAIILVSQRSSAAFFGAMVCCFLATFTHGNGILSFPAIVFYFLCLKDFKKAGLTAAFMIACLVIYLAGYESGQSVNLPKDVGSFLSSLFGFIGSALSLWAYPVIVSAIWGAVIVGFMICMLVKVSRIYFGKKVDLKPGTVELLTLFAFMLITSTVIALFRSWAGPTIASRFQIYASLSTIIFYIFLLYYVSFFRKKWVFGLITALSVFYWGYSHYLFTGIVASKKTVYLADVYNWEQNRSMFSVEKSIVRNANFYLLPAYKKGFFKLPEALVKKEELDSMFAKTGNATGSQEVYLEDWEIDRILKTGTEALTYSFVASNSFPDRKHFWDNRFLVLRHSRTGMTFLMNANPKIEARRQIITSGNYYKKGFNSMLRQDDLAAGSYELAVMDVSGNGEKAFYKLGQSLIASGTGFALK